MDFHQTALILWRSSLGMLMGEFRQFLTDLSAHDRSIFHFWMVTLVNVNRFSPNLVCALIFWRSALGLLIGKVRQFLTQLSARDTSVFSILDDNFTKCLWIFTKLLVCIDIVDICFGIAYGRILSIFDRVICPQHIHILGQ